MVEEDQSVDALEEVAAAVSFVEEVRYPWNQLAHLPPLSPEHLLHEPLVGALEAVEVVVVQEATANHKNTFRCTE